MCFTLQNKNQEPEEDPLSKLKSQKLVSCRICKGDHWTTKCPYKDTLAPIQVCGIELISCVRLFVVLGNKKNQTQNDFFSCRFHIKVTS